MADLLGQIDCSAPGVLSKAGLSGSKEGFNDRVKEGSYIVTEDHLKTSVTTTHDVHHL